MLDIYSFCDSTEEYSSTQARIENLESQSLLDSFTLTEFRTLDRLFEGLQDPLLIHFFEDTFLAPEQVKKLLDRIESRISSRQLTQTGALKKLKSLLERASNGGCGILAICD